MQQAQAIDMPFSTLPNSQITLLTADEMFYARGFGTVITLLRPRHSSRGRRLSLMVFSGSSPITTTSPSSKAHQKSGPFAPPALPGLDAHTTLSDSRLGRRLSRR
jgi:hypothetical protein